MLYLKGIPINQGITEGSVFIKINPVQSLLKKKYKTIDPSVEVPRYLDIINTLQEEFKQIQFEHKELSNTTNQQLAELYISLLQDPMFKKSIPEIITEQQIPAPYAILQKLDIIKQDFAKLNNEYFRSRYDDFESIGYQLLERLTGLSGYVQINSPVIIIAESLSAADLLHIPLEHIIGVITETGSLTSHAAILAESLDIPAVFNVKNLIESINTKDSVIMDGYAGEIVINPTAEISSFYKNLAQRHLQYEQNILNSFKEKHTTKDGYNFFLLANISNAYDIPLIFKYHADGIGLFRTETMVLLEESLLSEQEQSFYFESFLKETKNLPISIRTLDLGGDKTIKNSKITPLDEDNPFLGYRSTRQFIKDPTEFQKQVRAVLRSYHINPNIKILIPFVTNLDDFLKLKSITQECYYELYKEECPIPIGMMAEVPSVLICIEDYLPHTDFISIGTNDLTQYILATDRNNTHVSHYHCSTHPSVIRLLSYVTKQCNKNQIPISICGEIAKEPYFIRLLYGLGIDTLSMSPTGIPMARYILANSTISECQNLVKKVISLQHHYEIEELLHSDLILFLQQQDSYFDHCFFSSSRNKK